MSMMIRQGDSVTIETDVGRQVSGVVGTEIGCGGQGCAVDVSVTDVSMPGQVVVKWWAAVVRLDDRVRHSDHRADARVAHPQAPYRDINMDNVFVQPDTGAALICDTDNIGFEKRPYMGVMGKDDFMAPEIVSVASGPNANTDWHSLAVPRFMLFARWHPLGGARTEGLMDEDARTSHFGTKPVFCVDPTNPSNLPLAGECQFVTAGEGISREPGPTVRAGAAQIIVPPGSVPPAN